MNRLPALLTALALLLAGCADARSGTLGPAPRAAAPSTAGAPVTAPTAPPGTPTAGTPGPTATRSTAPVTPPRTGTPSPAGTGSVTVQLWFARAGVVVPTRRTRPTTVATSRLALAELAAGPTSAEAATGLATLVPAGVEMVRIAEGTATVAPPPSFADTDAPTLRLRRAQVVWTLTQFPTVRRVAFAGSGVVLARTDLADLLAPIVVTEPAIGQRVTGPVTVAGTADVYEATVSIRILDGSGRVVGTGFTTATCGSGCRGDYRGGVAYRLASAGPGTVEVYEVSPRDGSRTHVVAVPVLLAATA
ncbi:Sporulation and spore germination [Micromonospora purpureochromogenes]|uniref:Sporulation and spore germination n=1 Tax=Micromonospora purpureochromogenes TaxID=47872 RepID=A0A1C4YB22_9ACTN|nr:Gmad2 immunoglobulin-like domain-containing protein [Micromonospora purpureochromogenes]SCF17905.1 Sporulation and spore germination [Micromonospora purpureochromogenes]